MWERFHLGPVLDPSERDKMADGRCPVLALDIGGTKLAVAVITADGRTHGLKVESTGREGGPEIIGRLFEMAQGAIVASGFDDVSAVGISCGGPLDSQHGILTGPLHLPGWVNIPIVEMAEEKFRIPATLLNDATAGALGEYRYGAARDTHTMVYLTISTGIGGGAVVGVACTAVRPETGGNSGTSWFAAGDVCACAGVADALRPMRQDPRSHNERTRPSPSVPEGPFSRLLQP